MPVIYDSVHCLCGNIFREHKTKQWHQSYYNRRKEVETSAFADDITVAHLETQLMHFEKATDIKYNNTKFMGIYLGSNKGNPRKTSKI